MSCHSDNMSEMNLTSDKASKPQCPDFSEGQNPILVPGMHISKCPKRTWPMGLFKIEPLQLGEIVVLL